MPSPSASFDLDNSSLVRVFDLAPPPSWDPRCRRCTRVARGAAMSPPLRARAAFPGRRVPTLQLGDCGRCEPACIPAASAHGRDEWSMGEARAAIEFQGRVIIVLSGAAAAAGPGRDPAGQWPDGRPTGVAKPGSPQFRGRLPGRTGPAFDNPDMFLRKRVGA